ncbi:uncharacterized protein DDB_G0283697-like [Macadamia integrifolia]|uniref:uncharacterized protein DDB_G0283697-like n=1 Tax=Macadamia integrifolia TaxID=60698 RepID=UPI001C501FD9|nr:uncharacterized protein DDB_G0283697-like [Macadamia integrifolia]
MVAKDQDSHHQEESMRENLEQFEDSDAEESLSLCDLPIYDKSQASTTTTNWNGNDDDDDDDDDDPRRMSTDQELFEFFSDLKADICPADDIIFCGKLISYKEKECHREEDKNPNLDVFEFDDDDGNQTCTIKSFFRRRRQRSESLNALKRSQSSAKDRLKRTNYQKLRRVSSTTKNTVDLNDRYKTGKSSGKGNSSLSTSSTPARPRWPLLMFGMVNVPKEMELKDIRNRQNCRNPTLLFPEFVAGDVTEKVRVRREEKKGSWSLPRASSCRGRGCIPHV